MSRSDSTLQKWLTDYIPDQAAQRVRTVASSDGMVKDKIRIDFSSIGVVGMGLMAIAKALGQHRELIEAVGIPKLLIQNKKNLKQLNCNCSQMKL